jgi:hypothetical protein
MFYSITEALKANLQNKAKVEWTKYRQAPAHKKSTIFPDCELNRPCYFPFIRHAIFTVHNCENADPCSFGRWTFWVFWVFYTISDLAVSLLPDVEHLPETKRNKTLFRFMRMRSHRVCISAWTNHLLQKKQRQWIRPMAYSIPTVVSSDQINVSQ